MYNYDDLGFFLKVVNEGSFANAAKKLGIPPSTVSRRVTKLETALNISLIKRNPRKFQITQEGQALYKSCLPAFDVINGSITQLKNADEGFSGKLSITAPTFLTQELLSHWIIDFQKKYQYMDLMVFADNKLTDLIMDEVDLAIRIGPLEDSSLVAQKLWDAKMVVVASGKYLAENPAIQSPQDLCSHPALLYRSANEKWMFEHKEHGELVTIKPDAKFFINDIKTIVNSVTAGLGVACLPQFAMSAQLKNGEVRQVLEEYKVLPERSIYAVYRNGKFISKNAKVFLDFLRERFNQMNAT